MPHKFRRLSGAEVTRILSEFGFHVVSQRGSHMKLRRVTQSGERQTLTVPNHRELDNGTLRAIVRQASRYINPDDLGNRFFTE